MDCFSRVQEWWLGSINLSRRRKIEGKDEIHGKRCKCLPWADHILIRKSPIPYQKVCNQDELVSNVRWRLEMSRSHHISPMGIKLVEKRKSLRVLVIYQRVRLRCSHSSRRRILFEWKPKRNFQRFEEFLIELILLHSNVDESWNNLNKPIGRLYDLGLCNSTFSHPASEIFGNGCTTDHSWSLTIRSNQCLPSREPFSMKFEARLDTKSAKKLRIDKFAVSFRHKNCFVISGNNYASMSRNL